MNKEQKIKNGEASNNFLKGAVILGVAGVLVKVLGAIFKIPLANIILDTGMGYYTAAYPIYVMLLSIATTGFPIAISKMVSERRALGDSKGAHKVFKTTMIILILIGIITSTGIYFGAGYIVNVVLANENAFYPLIALAPALLIVPIMAGFRGYFQGRNNMSPTAISQIFEQLGRVIIGLSLAIILLPKGLEFAAAGASFGAVAGAVFGLIVIFIIYIKNKGLIKKELESAAFFEPEPVTKIIKELLMIAVPIIIGALVMPLMSFIDAAVVIRRLRDSGFDYETANAMYGQLGMGATLINLPQIVTSAIAISIVPVISRYFTIGDMESARYNAKLATRITTLIGLPAGIGLMVLSEPIMRLLYAGVYAKEPDNNLAMILFMLGMGVVFLSLIQSFTSILQGMGKAYVPVVNLFIGAVAKIACTYTLTAIPSINVLGAAIGTTSAYIIAVVLDFRSMTKALKLKFDVKEFLLKPLLTAGIMAIAARIGYSVFGGITLGASPNFMKNLLGTVTGMGLGGIAYIVALFKTNTITKKDFENLKKGEKIIKVLEKVKLI
ncbi:MAG: putative polysaccharide biosynthesis protein [Filifactoraceae bacterium]